MKALRCDRLSVPVRGRGFDSQPYSLSNMICGCRYRDVSYGSLADVSGCMRESLLYPRKQTFCESAELVHHVPKPDNLGFSGPAAAALPGIAPDLVPPLPV
jgi:hypothetical protein